MGSVELWQSCRSQTSPKWGHSGLPRRWLSKRWQHHTARSSKHGPEWQEVMAQKLEDRRGYLSEKWKNSNLAHGLSKGQEVLLEGWRSTDVSKPVKMDLGASQEKWRRAEKWRRTEDKEPNEWQQSAKSALTWTASLGQIFSNLVLSMLGLTATVVVGTTAILLFVPYIIIMGPWMDISLFYAAFQIALIQLFTVFSWLVYSIAEWSMTRTMNEEEKRRYIEDQELKQRQIEELRDFDTRLIHGDKQRKRFSR